VRNNNEIDLHTQIAALNEDNLCANVVLSQKTSTGIIVLPTSEQAKVLLFH